MINENQKAFLRGLVQSAIHSAMLAAIWRLPLKYQLAIVAAGTGLMMWWLS